MTVYRELLDRTIDAMLWICSGCYHQMPTGLTVSLCVCVCVFVRVRVRARVCCVCVVCVCCVRVYMHVRAYMHVHNNEYKHAIIHRIMSCRQFYISSVVIQT